MDKKPVRPLKEVLSSGIQEILDIAFVRAKEGIDKLGTAIEGLEKTMESVFTTPVFETKKAESEKQSTKYTEMDLLLRESMHAYRSLCLLKKDQVVRLCHLVAEVSAANGNTRATCDVRISPEDVSSAFAELKEKYSSVTITQHNRVLYTICIYWG